MNVISIGNKGSAGNAHGFSMRTFFFVLVAMLLVGSFAGPVAAQGLDKINQGAQRLLDLLNGISIIVVTIAVIFAGYKIIFQQARFIEVAPVLIGGILIGAAGQLAVFLLS